MLLNTIDVVRIVIIKMCNVVSKLELKEKTPKVHWLKSRRLIPTLCKNGLNIPPLWKGAARQTRLTKLIFIEKGYELFIQE